MSSVLKGIPSQAELARIANITQTTMRRNIRILLNSLLENGYSLKNGVEIVR